MVPAWVAIAVGGACGSLARYFIALWAAPVSRELPWGTIGINVAGSFLIGFFGTLTLESGRFPVPEWVRLLVMVGFCGGFTTFSSFSLQTLDLIRGEEWGRGLANIAVSVLLCLGSVALGHAVASHLNGGAIAIAENAVEEDAS